MDIQYPRTTQHLGVTVWFPDKILRVDHGPNIVKELMCVTEVYNHHPSLSIIIYRPHPEAALSAKDQALSEKVRDFRELAVVLQYCRGNADETMDLGGAIFVKSIFKNDFPRTIAARQSPAAPMGPKQQSWHRSQTSWRRRRPPGGTCWDRQNHLYNTIYLFLCAMVIPATWAWGHWEWMLWICMLAVGNWIRYPYWRMVISLSVGFCEPMIRNPEWWSGQKTSLGRWVVCIRWDASSGYPCRAQLITEYDA